MIDSQTILAADIGGTHCRFALFTLMPEEDSARLVLTASRRLRGADYSDFLPALLSLYQEGSDGSAPLLCKNRAPDAVVIAPAGPIINETCHLTNIDWIIRAVEVRETLDLRNVSLINDFVAQGYACLELEHISTEPVITGTFTPKYAGASLGIVGAGTGFGKAQIIIPLLRHEYTDALENYSLPFAALKQSFVLPSEGGHTEFPFIGQEEYEFAAYALKRTGASRLIGDAVVSGLGFAMLMSYFTGEELTPHQATARMAESPDAPATRDAVEFFARFYARGCRNFVLDTLCLRGLFITGGMALRVPALRHPAFAREFTNSETQRELLEAVPVWHVTSDQAGLWGAGMYARLHYFS